jgi:hypothetical protein
VTLTLDFGIAGGFSGATNFSAGGDSTLALASQDGLAAGALTKTTFDADGKMALTYSNGQNASHGQLALAWFDFLQGLEPSGQASFENSAGLAVHLGARVAAKAEAGEVLVSSTVKDLVVGSGIEFTDRGLHELKGVPGHWGLYAVAGQAEGAPLTSAAEHVTAADRLTLRLARRAPGALRAMGRLAARGS